MNETNWIWQKDTKKKSPSKEDKLDKIYDVLNHIRWIGLGLAGLFTVVFIVPHCT